MNTNFPPNCYVNVQLEIEPGQKGFADCLEKNDEIRKKLNALTDENEIEKIHQQLRESISHLFPELKKQARDSLQFFKISRLFQLVKYQPEKLLELRNIGELSMTIIMEGLHARGLCLGMDAVKFNLE